MLALYRDPNWASNVSISSANYAATSGAAPVDLTKLPSKATVVKVVCGADYAAVLLADGSVYSTQIVQKQAPSAKATASSAAQPTSQFPMLAPISRLKGLTVIDIAATAISIIAVTLDRKVHTISTLNYQKNAAVCTIPLRFRVLKGNTYERSKPSRFTLTPLEVVADAALDKINLYGHPYQGLGAATSTDLEDRESTSAQLRSDAYFESRARYTAFPSIQVAAGAVFFMIACREAGVVFAGGINQSGQLGIGSDDEKLEVKEGELQEVVFAPPLKHPVWRIRCGGCHTVALVPAQNDSTNAGSGSSATPPAPRELSNDDDQQAIAPYECHVYVWGRNANGQLGLPLSTERVNRPHRLEGVTAIDAACGDYSTVLLSKRSGGSIGVCGKNTSGQMGVSFEGEDRLSKAVTPVQWFTLTSLHKDLSSWHQVSSIACGGGFGVGHTVLTFWAQTGDESNVHGFALGAGSNRWGQIGTTIKADNCDEFAPVDLPFDDGECRAIIGGDVFASAGWMHSVVWSPTLIRAEKARQLAASKKKGKNVASKTERPSLLESIPPEARNHIIEYLLPKDALIVSRLNSLWHEHVRHCGTLWAGTLQRRFPISSERLQKELAAEKALKGGYLSYSEGVDYVKALASLAKEKYGAVYSHPDEAKEAQQRSKKANSFFGMLSSLNPFGPIRERNHRILMIGLDAAGKTTILYMLKLGEVATTVPTIGFNVETVAYKHINFTCWDIGGPDKLRALWRHYYENVSALIFVVDSNDRDRFEDASYQLEKVTSEKLLAGAPVVVIANKQDLPNAIPIEQVAYEFRKSLGDDRRWCVQGAAAKEGIGLWEGFSWLVDVLDGKKTAATEPQ